MTETRYTTARPPEPAWPGILMSKKSLHLSKSGLREAGKLPSCAEQKRALAARGITTPKGEDLKRYILRLMYERHMGREVYDGREN